MGGLLGAMPVCLLIGLVSWLVIFVTTRYVAVASLARAESACSIILYWSTEDNSGQLSKVILSILIMGWSHPSNLQRLRNGTENRFERKTKD